jgi:uncharacterized membrane protein YhaH (DUF805 family)
MSWYLLALKRYADFSGRSRRKEYWYFVLFNCIVLIALVLVAALLGGFNSNGNGGPSPAGIPVLVLYIVYVFAILVPSIAVGVRRLHDIGKSGWWFFINFIPSIGGIWFFVLMCLDSQPGPNQWGPNPKEESVVATAGNA